MKAVNWNKQDDFVVDMYNQQVKQLWFPEEFNVSKDLPSWDTLNETEKTTYKRILTGLTGLDTQQSDTGMPLLLLHAVDDQRKQAIYAFQGFMEAIHAKSYSTIFTTLLPSEETNYLLDEWILDSELMQYKGRVIERYYKALFKENPSKYELYMARVASVFLESFIFYANFFYPLLLAGQGKLTTSGEIIRKILLDETVHGKWIGWEAQNVYKELTKEEQERADLEVEDFLTNLYRNEIEWAKYLYDELELTDEVIDYIQFNGNRALENLGKPKRWNHKPINPIVLNATDTSTKNHDFFSTKGDGYVVPLKTEEISDDDFNF